MVSDLLLANPVNNGSERDDRSAPSSFTETFETQFPYYLSIGMTEEQFWDRDSTLVKYYREAEKLRQERKNQECWLLGMYVYDAIGRISPVLRSQSKKGAKPKPYVEEPYPINRETKEAVENKEEKAKAQKGMQFMQSFMIENNKKYDKKE